MSLYNKFVRDELTEADIKKWLINQSEARLLSIHGDDISPKNELDHVSMCLHHIFLWYTRDQPLGHFLTAVVKNNFTEACGRADSTNSKVLPIYAKFLYNCVPADYRKKAE